MPRPSAMLLLIAVFVAVPAAAENTIVRVDTPLGAFDIELCSEVSAICLGAAPNTVANFLAYVNDGAYESSFVHRRVRGFVIQGGSYFINESGSSRSIATNPPIASEFNQSNERGTVAVPLLGDPPGSLNPCDTAENSGTSGWFVSVGDNSSLDCGLFTVFGVVIGDGMTVVDAIDALTTFNAGGAFANLPLLDDYECMPNTSGACTNPVVPYLVYSDITIVPAPAAATGACLAIAALVALARWRR